MTISTRRIAAIALFAAFAYAASARAQAASHAACGLAIGLDPACPITAIGVTATDTPLTAHATQHGIALDGRLARRGREEFDLVLPIANRLTIDGEGSASGAGDARLGYRRVLVRHGRLAQTAGIALALPTGSDAFSSGRTRIAPSYAFSYALGDRVHLVLLGSYGFDSKGTRLPFSPRTQQLDVIPRAIVDLSQRYGIYAAIEGDGARVTGDERYTSYTATARLGIVRRAWNLSASYTEPLGTFSYEHLYHRSLGVELRWQPIPR